MKQNEDGTYTVTVDNKTQTFPDCVSAAVWVDEMRFESEEPPCT